MTKPRKYPELDVGTKVSIVRECGVYYIEAASYIMAEATNGMEVGREIYKLTGKDGWYPRASLTELGKDDLEYTSSVVQVGWYAVFDKQENIRYRVCDVHERTIQLASICTNEWKSVDRKTGKVLEGKGRNELKVEKYIPPMELSITLGTMRDKIYKLPYADTFFYRNTEQIVSILMQDIKRQREREEGK